jgi:hypothetical protein
MRFDSMSGGERPRRAAAATTEARLAALLKPLARGFKAGSAQLHNGGMYRNEMVQPNKRGKKEIPSSPRPLPTTHGLTSHVRSPGTTDFHPHPIAPVYVPQGESCVALLCRS